MRVLLVEDDPTTQKSIELMLSSAGMVVDCTDLGEDGLEIGKLYDYDIIILDLMLPDIDGMEVLRRLRDARIKTPVLILSGLTESENKVKGLGAGADDYLTKPFSPKELVLRIRTILRRSSPALTATILRYEGIEQNLDQYSVKRDGYEIQISPIEFKILRMFLAQPERVFSREQIISYAWDVHSDIELRTIDSEI